MNTLPTQEYLTILHIEEPRCRAVDMVEARESRKLPQTRLPASSCATLASVRCPGRHVWQMIQFSKPLRERA
jgi:hypothetical protein